MNVISAIWFSFLYFPGSVGIVLGVDEITGERKAYIGVRVSGSSEQKDIESIRQFGSPLGLDVLKTIVNFLEKEN